MAVQDKSKPLPRLAQVVAARVPCTRREAEQYITEGWVTVDGQPVDLPQFRVAEGQRVEIDPKARLQPLEPATLLLHQPAGTGAEDARALLGAATRWAEDPSAMRYARSHVLGQAALLPLPPFASGLTVFSQDGRIVRRLREDADFIEQELVVEVAGSILPDGLARLSGGMVHRGKALPEARVSWQSETRLRFAAKGLALDALPWMCEQVGLQLKSLRRIRVGRIPMAGLPAGQWRYLVRGEWF